MEYTRVADIQPRDIYLITHVTSNTNTISAYEHQKQLGQK